MLTPALLLSLVVGLLSRVPMLIAVILGLVLVWRAPRGSPRRSSLIALWLLFGCVLGEVVLQVIPLMLMEHGDLRHLAAVVGVLRLVLTSIQAIGVGMLAWTLALCLRRLPPQADVPTAPDERR
ncbi:hypothetical protein CKY51_10960 [Xanthomonas maliensis]|nr:hypothetical protein [Xanthomonas maliensis]KAB7767583.1 hypothetical protein CKY51_10960 [Xanthomonas maliensis]